jgi:hypothetical protein
MKRCVLFMVFVTFVLGFFVMTQTCYAAKTVKVGFIDSFSGGAAPMTIDNLNGFKMAINEVTMQREELMEPGSSL